jgi:hypothetical protein
VIVEQPADDEHLEGTRRFYAYCWCGVVGRLRRTLLLAALDEGAHADAHLAAERVVA